MKKLFVLMVLLSSCLAPPKSGSYVRHDLRNIYLSSVSVVGKDKNVAGSGTIIYSKINQQLIVLTAAHVVRAFGKEEIFISTKFDNIKRLMKICKVSDEKDIALLCSVNKEVIPRPFVRISNKSPLIGDKVWVIGSPAGSNQVLTNGIVSNFEKISGKQLYRTNAEIYYGSSGGGMFNTDGELIGIAHLVLRDRLNIFSTMIIPGANFFVRLEEIKDFI